MITIKQLEQKLFELFPACDATPGDRIGLLVGNPGAQVGKVALTLDAKVADIEAAAAAGCNVLLTHHPVFWLLPDSFLSNGPSSGAAIIRAAELGVALIAFHTNLDCAPRARNMLLEPAGFSFDAPLALPQETDAELQGITGKTPSLAPEPEHCAEMRAALGQLGAPVDGNPVSFEELVHRYKEAFGAVAKAWGDPQKPIRKLATCSGGGGSLVQRVIACEADCYVTGEVAYHEALELSAAGIALVELGHDRSELPYRYYLQEALTSLGFKEEQIEVLEPTSSWWQ